MNEILIGGELQVSILLQLWVLIHEYDDFFLVLKKITTFILMPVWF